MIEAALTRLADIQPALKSARILMSDQPDKNRKKALDRLADKSGLALAIVDGSRNEIAVSNNNSICRNLNPGPGFSPECDRYCGAAFDKATNSGKVLRFECHAGLECRAVPVTVDDRPLVAIIGRAFINSERYRTATDRAISGDWRQYPPNEFFENVLLSNSASALDEAVKEFKKLAAGKSAEEASEYKEITRSSAPEDVSPIEQATDASPRPEQPTDDTPAVPSQRTDEPRDASSWRSFFGSILNVSYAEATSSILEFISQQFGYKALVWLDKRDTKLENSNTFGDMKGRRIRLGIEADDERLLKAVAENQPLELGERSKADSSANVRKMTLFPIGVSGKVSAALAVLDPISNDNEKELILRICRSIAPQLEILRLRSEVERGDALANAVRRFSESLKRPDDEDLWLNVTQNAAEMLKAERSSLLVFDDKANAFRIKAMLGTQAPPIEGEEIGSRVAKLVFSRNRAIAVADISKAGLKPGLDRRYKTRSFLSCPISVGGRTIGVMNFTDRACGEAFDKESLELFQAIAPQLAVAIDRASLKEKAGEFEQLSVTDTLTGLLNRRYIEERLLEEVKRSNRHGYPMSFMMLDVDQFKPYNDSFGHPAGDVALKIVGNVIRDTLRGADVAARFGGEEFAILLPQTTIDEAAIIADRIRSNIQETKFPHRAVTVSIGVSSCSAELCVTADLISAADQALYEAKRLGRNMVLTFDEMRSRKQRRPQ